MAALALTPLVGVTTPAQADAPTPTHGLDFDYFDEVYTDLGPDSVFETVTLERFKYILRSKPGNFAFLIGDPNDVNTQATIGHINDVAQDLGIEKIYNFTPKIDGGKWNIWNWQDLASVAGGNALNYWKNEGPTTATGGNPADHFTTHTDDYLNKDTDPQFVRDGDGVIEAPYLFVYNKDRKVDVDGTPTEDRIVSSLTDRLTPADLDTPGEVAAYKDKVADVLDDVPADEYAVNTAFEFWKDEANRRHSTTYADASLYGGEILDDSDAADGWRVQPITYPEWIALLKHDGDIPFLFGGTWCHNTRAIVKSVNKYAQQYGVKKVYNFDFSLFASSNGGSNHDHARSSGTNITTGTGADTRLLFPSNLYGQTVNTYLTNAIAEYGAVGQVGTPPNTPHYYYPDGDVTKPVENSVRLQVGHVLTYNRNHRDAAGNPAPVVDQAIRQKDDGRKTEYMTEWWFVKGRDLPVSDATWRGNAAAGSNALANQRAFAKETVDDIEQVFRGFTSNLPSTATVTGVGSQVAKGSSVTLDVALDAAGYAPYLSQNGASASADPATLVAKPRGWVRLLDAQGTEVARARTSRAGTISFPLGAQSTVGAKSYTVQYLGRGALIAPTTQTLSFEVVRPGSSTTLAAPSATAYGVGGTLTATVTAGATGTARLLGLPTAINAAVTGGIATFAVPANLAVGSYQVRVQYLGDAEHAPSESAARTVVVGKGQAGATTFKVKGKVRPNKAGAATVSVATPAGLATPGGSVKVTLTKGKKKKVVTVKLAGAGTTKVKLPKLTTGVWKASLVYQGDATYQAGSPRTAKIKVQGKTKFTVKK